ncbi:MAG TPA: hypothetical protein DDZ83_01870, partial [Nitrospinae bacterium]|nr:hypothetical protein [Nitrospinota bacterium]
MIACGLLGRILNSPNSFVIHAERNPMELGLEGKTAIVTGASMGLGLATAGELMREGCNVTICARGEETLRRARDQIQARTPGAQALAVRADMSVSGDIERLVRETAERFGTVDILVNNAGVTRYL